jgi:hypothetical protein
LQIKTVHRGVTLNAAFYSRLRELNPDASYSVNG